MINCGSAGGSRIVCGSFGLSSFRYFGKFKPDSHYPPTLDTIDLKNQIVISHYLSDLEKVARGTHQETANRGIPV